MLEREEERERRREGGKEGGIEGGREEEGKGGRQGIREKNG